MVGRQASRQGGREEGKVLDSMRSKLIGLCSPSAFQRRVSVQLFAETRILFLHFSNFLLPVPALQSSPGFGRD